MNTTWMNSHTSLRPSEWHIQNEKEITQDRDMPSERDNLYNSWHLKISLKTWKSCTEDNPGERDAAQLEGHTQETVSLSPQIVLPLTPWPFDGIPSMVLAGALWEQKFLLFLLPFSLFVLSRMPNLEHIKCTHSKRPRLSMFLPGLGSQYFKTNHYLHFYLTNYSLT